jgi:hypothetical protein
MRDAQLSSLKNIMDGRVVSSDVVHLQKALGTLPEDGNVMPKHVGDTIYNKLNE